MKRAALTLFLFACLSMARTVHAAPPDPEVARAYRQARAAVVVPVEWDGVWVTVDSTYICGGALQSTGTSSDTICGGKDYAPGTQGSPITFDCTGNATATTFDMTCTASGELFPDCSANYTVTTHGTRSGDSYFMVSTIEVAYTGTACDFLPPTCNQYNTWGTRTGPAPPAYCAIPTVPSSWGRIKTRYR